MQKNKHFGNIKPFSTEEPRKYNPFLENMGKFVHREVEVVMYEGKKGITMKGECEAVDYHQKAVIIRNDKGTFLIPRYIYLGRARPYSNEVKKK